MPWLSKTKKDVISCDKLGGGANNRYIPRFLNGGTQYVEDILSLRGRKPGELKHLSTRRKRKQK
jgi:hypothetical protein